MAVTPALACKNRQILSVWWPDTLTKMRSFWFNERSCLKTRRQKGTEENTQGPLLVSTCVPTYMSVLNTYTYGHMFEHTITTTTKQKPLYCLVNSLGWLCIYSSAFSSPFLYAPAALAQPELSSCLRPLHWLPLPLLGIETGLSLSIPSGVFSNVTCSERFPKYHIGSNAPLFHRSLWFIFLCRLYPHIMFHSPVGLHRTTSPLQ